MSHCPVTLLVGGEQQFCDVPYHCGHWVGRVGEGGGRTKDGCGCSHCIPSYTSFQIAVSSCRCQVAYLMRLAFKVCARALTAWAGDGWSSWAERLCCNTRAIREPDPLRTERPPVTPREGGGRQSRNLTMMVTNMK